MAEIHLARLAGEAGFEKTVVVKRLLPELVASRAFVAMFLDEGRLVAQINHPNVCEVYELGREGNEYFLVMPYLDGVPATDFIARPRESDRLAQLRVAAGIIAQACAGLHHAHELRGADGESLGLVHRDVSPSNLFVTTAGVVKVLDFGVAKVRGGEATEVGTIKGKTQYMAPEQLVGEPLDRRCDVFALGIVLFELATHQRLFKRSSEFLTAKAILEEDIQRADAVDPAVPTALADVIAKALARKRDDRYATARELGAAIEGAIKVASSTEIADALAQWHGEELSALRTRQREVIAGASQIGTTPIGRSQIVTKPARPQRMPTEGSPADMAPRRRAALVPVMLASVAGIGAIGYFVTRSSPSTTSSPDAGVVVDARPLDSPADSPADSPIDSRPPDAAMDASVAVVVEKRDAPKPKAGFVSIDSTPFATIFVDDKRLGITPLVKKPLAAGKHRIRAVLKDGRTKELTVDIPAGKLAPPVLLTW